MTLTLSAARWSGAFDDFVGAEKDRGGKANPRRRAAAKLMTISKRVGCSTGSSDGSAPFEILSTMTATRLCASGPWTPKADNR